MAGSIVGSDAPVELAYGTVEFLVLEGGTLGIADSNRRERLPVHSGDTVTLAPTSGARLYIAAEGGWVLPAPQPDSEARLQIHAGDVLACPGIRLRTRVRFARPHLVRDVVRVLPGPQRNLWEGEAPEIVAGASSDRRGVRFSCGRSHRVEIPSEPCVVGSFQWTPAGEFIALGPDGPVVGGYPKPFVALGADLPIIAQAIPGTRLRLREVAPPR